jgi:hypothetical protein
MFLGLLDPDPLFRGMDPDPSIIKPKKVRKTLISTVLQKKNNVFCWHLEGQ